LLSGLLFSLAALAAGPHSALAAAAAGPFSYVGHGGERDWARWRYGPVHDDETQQLSFQLDTGAAGGDRDMHWGIGLRGGASLVPCPLSDAPQYAEGCLLGRGITLGHVPDGFGTGGGCEGIAVEDFTAAWDGTESIVAGTCVRYPLRPNRRHAFIVTVTRDNVSWVMLDLGQTRVYDAQTGRYEDRIAWLPVARGGCLETAGRPCPELPEVDRDYGDVFITSAFLDEGLGWKVSDLRIVDY
jgi:hypothetical protein